MIVLEIPFEPVPWASPRLGKHTCYDPRERDKRAIRYLVKEQYKGPVIEEYVNLIFLFGFSMPKSATKKQRDRMLAQEIIPTKCDCTNLQKLFEDCLKGIVFKDDRLVESISSKKLYREKPFMFAIIYTRNDTEDVVLVKEVRKCG